MYHRSTLTLLYPPTALCTHITPDAGLAWVFANINTSERSYSSFALAAEAAYWVDIGENSLYNCAKQQKDFYTLGKKSPFRCFCTLHTPKDIQDDLIF